MLVTFHSEAGSSVTLVADVAIPLLKMAGHSGRVPSALLAGNIPSAIERLNHKIAATGTSQELDAEQPLTPAELQLRACQLIQLLSAAARQGCHVKWQEHAPAV